jgi:hypothetical protein
MRTYLNLGQESELSVMSKFLKKGFVISWPFGGKSSYDFIADKDKLYKVQVKQIYKSKNSWVVDFMKPKGYNRKYRHYTKIDCDILVAHNPEYNICYIFPVEIIENKRRATFYFESDPPKNANKNVMWVNNYKDNWNF